ncbi:MAG TPA: molybdopterin-dependent oxidoreductase [Amaricoccus sp.]|uniref:molybdopterin-dependent oxidoreductase n=1 Tax=Amaricoccus sp. TaxID=1872485 RepID=UPI002BDE3791|nr:molybdopterin-dependent oxidoreductase [Amaricoccus sp.]HMQ93443.1 molybdopterin-dependent oxidoreductase [Amaricoccus sp.]HMR54043.1 molybdopterin-dependent oxidoreductase [Amaricoccus sp.]HMR61255.1 molybdopterin-dependent oxidoreductase [Amaricoccus sp.]HMU01028.1 molybdopterin-dependent oxidoreductase [Amaricoccus sp.]
MLQALQRSLLATVLVLAAALPALAGGPVLVTVTGAVGSTNRGPFDAGYDKLFAFNDVTFERAMEFDVDALRALPQTTVTTDFPKDGPEVTFTGPALAEVLAAAQAQGETVTIQAMDGYAVEIPMAEIVGMGAVVAIERDGKPLGIGSFGPTQIVFPRSERADLADMPDDWWVWQIYHIKVE